MRIAHWIGLGLAAVPVPFAIYDVIMLRLWDAGWWLLFAAGYTAAICLAIYWTVRGIAKLASLLRRRSAIRSL